MTARDLQQLLADNETADTLRSAIEALADVEPHDPKWAAETRAEFLAELRSIEAQGSLF